MKKVLVTDAQGYIKAYWIRDADETTEHGIPDNPPDLNNLDWEGIKLRLHNLFVQEGFTTWQEVIKRHEEFSGLIASVVRNDIINLYKLQHMEVKKHG